MIEYPQQPMRQKYIRIALSIIVLLLAIWSASGLEISIDRLSKAPQLTWLLINALFPIDLSQEALDLSLIHI